MEKGEVSRGKEGVMRRRGKEYKEPGARRERRKEERKNDVCGGRGGGTV